MPPFQPPTSRSGTLGALIQRGRGLLSWLWAQEGSHGQRARGLAAGIFWGFLETFELVPHVPAWWVLPVWAGGLGVAQLWMWARER